MRCKIPLGYENLDQKGKTDLAAGIVFDSSRQGACDLHIHTLASDGSDSAAAIVHRVIANRLHCFSVTDHDSIQGVTETIQILRELDTLGIPSPKFIPGIELTAEEEGEIHILGYFPFGGYEKMEEFIFAQQKRRNERNIRLCELLTQKGMLVNIEQLKSQGSGVIGRIHAANILLQKGYVNSIKQAFDLWIGENKPCYVRTEKPSSKEVIHTINCAGGVAVLAHPFLYGWCSNTTHISPRLLTKLNLLKNYGLTGAEAFHGESTFTQCLETHGAALTAGLISTVGSDYHGINKQGIRMFTAEDQFWHPNERIRVMLLNERNQQFLMIQNRRGLTEAIWEFPSFYLKETDINGRIPASVITDRTGVELGSHRHYATEIFDDEQNNERLVCISYKCTAPELKILGLYAGDKQSKWFKLSELSGFHLRDPDASIVDKLRQIPLLSR